MAGNKTFTELTTLATVDKDNDWMAVVDVSDTTASTYGTTKKANVAQFVGEKGDAATVDVGTTTTGAEGTNASVVNVGTTSAAVFNFTIPRGNTGATGATGADGDSAYVYIAYASDSNGTGFTTTFNPNLDYIAIKTTTVAIPTPSVSDFTGLWKNYKGSQGIQGETGLTGEAGADGNSAYVYIAYASDASGTDFTTTFNASLDYVAIKTTTSPIASPQASDFVGLWKNYKGQKGDKGDKGDKGNTGLTGPAGADGVDGEDAYVYIAYASDASGTGFTTTFNANLDYIAIKSTTTPIATPQASDFTGLWKNYKGIQGIQGEQGVAGDDGESAYVYIAYASDTNGTGFTTTFSPTLNYIAIKSTNTEIVSPQASDFTGLWFNYKGEKGDQGPQGEKGDAATVNVGTTTTGLPGTSASVVNSGSTSAAILDFTIPRGDKGEQGPQGPQGEPGEPGEDGLDITWRGTYSASTSYVVNDAVYYNGGSYICIQNTTGNLPTSETYWNLMAAQGEPGEGSGDVVGPDGATDNAIARFDLATGKLIQNSLATVSDTGSINIPAGQQYLVGGSPVEGYSDEQAQDAVGSILTDTAEIDLTYNDTTPSITASIKAGSIDETKLDTSVNASLDLADNAIQKKPNVTAINDTGIADGEIAVFNLTNKDIRTSDKTITTSLGADDTTVPTSKAVKDVTDTKITAFADPNADRLVFWDDSATAFGALTPSTGLTITNTAMTVRGASTTQTGIVELATTAETETGTDATRAVTPDALHDMTTLAGASWMLDEDNMASNSAVKVPSQQSTKAYADTKLAKATNVTAINDTGIADGEVAVFNLTNKDIRTSDKTIVTTLGADDTTLPTSKAVADAISASGGYTDENAQDAVGTILTDTTTIDFTYTDDTPSIKADVKSASLTTSHLASGVLDTDLSSVSASDNTLPSAKATKTYVDSTKFTWRGAWATTTAYAVNDTVQQGGSGYVCVTAHTSGTFATDLSAGKWNLLVEGLPTPNLTTSTTTNLTGVITGNGSVLASKANPSGAIVGTTDTQTLTNKTIDGNNNTLKHIIPAGSITMYGGSTAPTGYLLCDGSAVSRTTYADLFTAIGTTYGTGDGSTTFNVPNVKGKVPVGRDSGDTSFDTLGETGGEKTHTLTTAEMPVHSHAQYVTANPGSGGSGIRQDFDADASGLTAYPQGVNTGGAGSGGSHNNLQPYIVFNYIIKT